MNRFDTVECVVQADCFSNLITTEKRILRPKTVLNRAPTNFVPGEVVQVYCFNDWVWVVRAASYPRRTEFWLDFMSRCLHERIFSLPDPARHLNNYLSLFTPYVGDEDLLRYIHGVMRVVKLRALID